MIIAYEIGYLNEADAKLFQQEYEVLGKMIGALIKAQKS